MTDKEAMDLAFQVKLGAMCALRKVGVVILGKDGELVSTGYNKPVAGCAPCDGSSCKISHMDRKGNQLEFCNTVHAEVSALMAALKAGGSVEGGTIYITTSPCFNCASAVLAAGIGRVVYPEVNYWFPTLQQLVDKAEFYLMREYNVL